MNRHFAELGKRTTAAGVPWLLDDETLYQRRRALILAGKVIALRGGGVVRLLGERLQEHGQEVGLLYLSNHEQYLLYGPDFGENVAALPFAAGGLTLRTWPSCR